MKKTLKSILKYNLLILRLWLVAQRLSPAVLHHPIRCIVPYKRSKGGKRRIVPDTKNVIIIHVYMRALFTQKCIRGLVSSSN